MIWKICSMHMRKTVYVACVQERLCGMCVRKTMWHVCEKDSVWHVKVGMLRCSCRTGLSVRCLAAKPSPGDGAGGPGGCCQAGQDGRQQAGQRHLQTLRGAHGRQKGELVFFLDFFCVSK